MILMPSHPEEVWALVRVAGSDQDGAMYLTAGFTGLRMGGAARPAVARRQLQRRDDSRASQLQRPRRRRLAEERPGPVGGDGPRRRPASGCARRPRVLCRARGPGVRQRARHLPGCFLDPHPLPGRPLARAGLPQLRFDDLRHSFGTLAVRRAEVPAVQAWMGHSDIQTTMRYVHHRDRGDEAKRPKLRSAQVTPARLASGWLPARPGCQHDGAYSLCLRRERGAAVPESAGSQVITRSTLSRAGTPLSTDARSKPRFRARVPWRFRGNAPVAAPRTVRARTRGTSSACGAELTPAAPPPSLPSA